MYENELKLFQRNNNSIWTDEHVSKTLLETQLDESNDAASRMPERRIKTVNWINTKIKANSKIIDFGCGPGLYAFELGKMGHKVLGIDFNKESIKYAQENKFIDGFTEYKCCSYLDKIEGKFDVAIMIFCDFASLTPDEQKLFLEKLGGLLEDDGIFIFDVFGKEEMGKQNEYRNWYISNGGDFWSNEPYFMMEEKKFFKNEDTIGARYYLVNQKDGKIKEFIMSDQYYDDESIKKLIQENGFEVLEINRDLMNYREETLFVITRKKNL